MKSFPANPWTLALLAAVLSLSVPAFVTQEPTQSPQDQGQSQQRDNGQATENSFAGRISKGSKGKLMLVDAGRNTSLLLDNQALAKKYEGKNVDVTGTLDEADNILHVKRI